MQVRDIANASLILAMRLAARAAPTQKAIGRLGASGPRGGWGMRLYSSAAQRNHILSHSAQRLPSLKG